MYCWEIANGAPITQMKADNKMRNIHLLHKEAFIDRQPSKVIAKHLNIEEAAKRIVYIGMNPKIPGKDKDEIVELGYSAITAS